MARINYKRTLIPAQGDLRLFLNTELAKLETALQQVFALAGDIDMLLGASEGDMQMSIIGGTIAGTAVYSGNKGRYIRIGRAVLFAARITWTGHTGTGTLDIGGLPFPAAADLSLLCQAQLGVVGVAMPATNVAYFDPAAQRIFVDTVGYAARQNIIAAGDIFITALYFTP